MKMLDPVKTAARTLDLFEVFADVKTPLSLTEVAKRIGAPVSSCHGLIRTLKTRGYIYELGARGPVYPTRRLLDIANLIASYDPVMDRLAPLLEALRDATGETVIIGRRQGDQIVYMNVFEGLQTIRYMARPGDIKPLHSSAIGKAVLSSFAPDELDAVLGRLVLKRVTQNTITDRAALLDSLAAGRSQGYHVTRGENVPEVMGMAIACRVESEVFGIALAGPTERMTRSEEAYAERLLRLNDIRIMNRRDPASPGGEGKG
jgi:DNA-binding IclR family transcriptional regulator